MSTLRPDILVPGEPITAEYLNRVSRGTVQRICVNGGRGSLINGVLTVEIPPGRGGAGGSGFVGKLVTCRDAHGIATVHKITGEPWSDTEGEDGIEGDVAIDVRCPPGLITHVDWFCYVAPADGLLPPWIIRDIIPVYPRVPATIPEDPITPVEEGELGPFQYDPPVAECGGGA